VREKGRGGGGPSSRKDQKLILPIALRGGFLLKGEASIWKEGGLGTTAKKDLSFTIRCSKKKERGVSSSRH